MRNHGIKLLAFSLFLAIVTLLLPSSVEAIYDPLSVPNNKFGIHITSEKDLDGATSLVNSEGGDWGYVTVVITEGERDIQRWQKFFDHARRLHLIPIVRIASKASGEIWEVPKEEEIPNWTAFLNSLNWVIKNRYIIIGNEPNRPNEWGDKVDPAGYANYLVKFSDALKAASVDYFVLPAALDPQKNEQTFIKEMIKAQPLVLTKIDGWASHSYPSSSIDVYKKELLYIDKKLPVFITETGWSTEEFSEETIGKKYTSAFQNEWSDKNIVAVTPFILNYPQAPFAGFSWQKSDGSFYKHYDDVKLLPKLSGFPIQEEKGEILTAIAQPVSFQGSSFVGLILAKNTGQSIWKKYEVAVGSDAETIVFENYYINTTEPSHLALVYFKASTDYLGTLYGGNLYLTGSRNNKISNPFRFETLRISINKVKIGGLFDRIRRYLPF